MNTGDWLILLATVPTGFGYAGYAFGKAVGRKEARPCTICRSAEQPRHDQHSTWRCVDMDGCASRNERRERERNIRAAAMDREARFEFERTYMAQATNSQLARAGMAIPGDQAVRVDLREDPPAGDPEDDRYSRLLDEL